MSLSSEWEGNYQQSHLFPDHFGSIGSGPGTDKSFAVGSLSSLMPQDMEQPMVTTVVSASPTANTYRCSLGNSCQQGAALGVNLVLGRSLKK